MSVGVGRERENIREASSLAETRVRRNEQINKPSSSFASTLRPVTLGIRTKNNTKHKHKSKTKKNERKNNQLFRRGQRRGGMNSQTSL